MDGAGGIPPEAWDVILKSGNALAVVMGALMLRQNERLARLSERVVVVETKLGLKGGSNGNEN